MTDEEYMMVALKQAQKAASLDEVPVGAVLVDSQSGQIVAKAYNRSEYGADPCAHAEILLIRKAAKKLKSKRLWGFDMYVTLEPCAMCAAASSLARIRKIVFGASDSKGGAIINGVKYFESVSCHHRPEISYGVLETECSHILKDFFIKKRIKK